MSVLPYFEEWAHVELLLMALPIVAVENRLGLFNKLWQVLKLDGAVFDEADVLWLLGQQMSIPDLQSSSRESLTNVLRSPVAELGAF